MFIINSFGALMLDLKVNFENEKDIQQRIFADRVIFLNQHLLYGLVALSLCVLITFIGLYQITDHYWLYIWLAVFIIIVFLHCFLILINHQSQLPLQLHFGLLIFITALYGSFWGVTGSFLMPDENPSYQMLIIIIIIGVTSGGLHTLQSSIKASYIFFLLSIIPLSAWFFLQKEPTYPFLGVVLIVYFLFMLTISWLDYSMFNNNLRLRYNNLDLINKLYTNNIFLAESETRFHAAFDYAAIGMALVSLEGHWLKVNKSLCQIVGYNEGELLSMDFQKITYPDDLKEDLNFVQQLLANEISSYKMEKRYIHKNGQIVWISLSVALVKDTANQPLYFISQIQDIDSQKKAEEELKFIAYHDVLTGLGNRKQLELSFEFALTYAMRYKTHIAIMFLDVDHFKGINDKFGHDIGDLLLIKIASRLKIFTRSTDIVVRLGGDEFIIVLTEIADIAQVYDIAKKILVEIAKPMDIKKHPLSITASIGISIQPEDGNNLELLIKRADEALYAVKSEGRNNYKCINKC